MSVRGRMGPYCCGAALALCLAWAFAACSSGERKPVRHGAAGAEASGGATGGGGAAGAEASGGAGPSALRVEFEELPLEGEPTLLTDFAFYPGRPDDFLALDKSGLLRHYRIDEERTLLIASARLEGVYDKLDCGAVSLAFEPDFAEGDYVYVATCVGQTHSEVLRVDLDYDLNPVEGSQISIVRVGHSSATRPLHNVGSIGFEPGGILWALFGEKGQGAPAQDPTSDLGKLLRIVPSRVPGLGGFDPAPDGPLVGDPHAAQAAYALGLRSPFRGTRDSRGFYWVGDVGGDLFEEINVVRAPLDNFGWPEREGPCDDCGESLPPAFSWPHGADADYVADDPEVETTIGRVAWVGPEVLAHEPDRYRGQLAGSVLFGDYCAGFLRHGRVDDDGRPTLDEPLGHLNNAAAFRQRDDGYLYALTFGRCQSDVANSADEPFSRLYRMVAKD